MDTVKSLERSLERLEPTGDYILSLTQLLLAEAKRKYTKYQVMDRNFRQKYGLTFEEFSKSELMQEPSYEVEQDFFDWDMAITGMEDMLEEIEHLQNISLRSP